MLCDDCGRAWGVRGADTWGRICGGTDDMGFGRGSDLTAGLGVAVDVEGMGFGSSNSGLRCSSLLSNLGG